jgi:hypothetical protein
VRQTKTAEMMKPDAKPQKTLWHRLLGGLLKELLLPTGILVYTDVPVMGDPPEADILLLRKKQPLWTAEQRAVAFARRYPGQPGHAHPD